MSMRRPAPIHCIILGLLLLGMACSAKQRQSTLKASFVTLNAARDGFFAWDLEHQKQIRDSYKDKDASKEEVKAAIGAWREARQPILEGLEIAYNALIAAVLQSDDPSFVKALAEGTKIIEAIKTFKDQIDKKPAATKTEIKGAP
jgi:hypothetical protein